MLIKLFVIVVRPTLENCNSVWGPLFALDQRKIKRDQRRATRLLSLIIIRVKPYEERLSILQLPSLVYRRLRSDMTLFYNNKCFSSDLSALYAFVYSITTTTCRGHQFTLFKYHSRLNCRSNYF